VFAWESVIVGFCGKASGVFIKAHVAELLRSGVFEGPVARFPEVSGLKNEEDLHRVLIASGGGWSRRRQGYLFVDLFPHGDAGDWIKRILGEGKTSRPLNGGIVSCPVAVAEDMVVEAGIAQGETVLEPSAGRGVLAAAAAASGAVVDCVEVDRFRCADIVGAGFARTVSVADFLTLPQRPIFESVLMYPPHRLQVAAAHIVHAHGFLRPGGRLAALVTPGLVHGVQKAAVALRDLWELHGEWKTDLDPNDLLSPDGRPIQTQIWYMGA